MVGSFGGNDRKEPHMKGLRASAVAVSVLALSLANPAVKAADKTPASITVAFGTGLNNAQQGNTPNHHIIPQEFRVRITRAEKLNGDVVIVPATVNFIVAGFHWAWVYQDGVTLEEVAANIPDPPATFVNYEVLTNGVSNVFAKGVSPISNTTLPLSSAANRTDSFAFSTPGKYLVICNVRGHFVDGMYAWITVVDEDEDDN
jgi:plastocyanin